VSGIIERLRSDIELPGPDEVDDAVPQVLSFDEHEHGEDHNQSGYG
jgi:hypothetical protein